MNAITPPPVTSSADLYEMCFGIYLWRLAAYPWDFQREERDAAFTARCIEVYGDDKYGRAVADHIMRQGAR